MLHLLLLRVDSIFFFSFLPFELKWNSEILQVSIVSKWQSKSLEKNCFRNFVSYPKIRHLINSPNRTTSNWSYNDSSRLLGFLRFYWTRLKILPCHSLTFSTFSRMDHVIHMKVKKTKNSLKQWELEIADSKWLKGKSNANGLGLEILDDSK